MTLDENKVISLPPDRRDPPPPVKIPPSYKPEQSLLGAILVRSEVFQAVIDAGVRPLSFDGTAHAIIFKAMLALHEEQAPIDLPTVCTRLEEQGKLEEAGGYVFLAGLNEEVGRATNAEYYAHLVLKFAWRRDYRQTLLQLNSLEQDPTASPDDLVTLLGSKLADLSASCPGNYSPKTRLISLEELLAMDFPVNSELIADGIWPAETGLIVAAESGEGKSLLLNQIAISLAMGWDILGQRVPTARRTVIFQAENTLKTEQYRFRRMLEGLGIAQLPPNIAFFGMHGRLDLANPQDQKRIIAAIKDHGAEVFFLDPLISFHSVNENDNVAMRHVLDCVTDISRKTGAGSGIMHHFGKPTANGTLEYRTRGAMAIRDWTDTLIALTAKKGEGGKFFKQLNFLKVRNGYTPKPILVQRDENFICHVTEVKSIFSPEQVPQTIRAKGGRVAGWQELVAAIQDALGCSQRDAQNLIKSATEKQLIQIVPGDRAPGKKGPVPNVYTPCDLEIGDDNES